MNAIKRLASGLIGFVFFLAGFLKLMDPVGASLAMGEYYKFLHLDFLRFSAGFVGVSLAFAEGLLGIALLTGVWRRRVGIISGIFLAFFTLVTLVLWIFNPEMDCGCFGSVITLTHFQSFIKNVVLCLLWAVAFVPFGRIGGHRKIKLVSFGIASVSLLCFTIHSLFSVPAFDNTDYAPSFVICSEPDGYDNTVLSFYDSYDEYCDNLALGARVAVVSVYNPRNLSEGRWKRIASYVETARSNGFRFLLLVASTPDEVGDIISDKSLLRHTYFADRKMLMTLNRSNGGLTYIGNSQIIAKWSVYNYPDEEKLRELASRRPAEAMVEINTAHSLGLEGFFLYMLAVMFLL